MLESPCDLLQIDYRVSVFVNKRISFLINAGIPLPPPPPPLQMTSPGRRIITNDTKDNGKRRSALLVVGFYSIFGRTTNAEYVIKIVLGAGINS